MPTFNETLTNYQNAVMAIAAQEVIVNTSLDELKAHAQDAQDNGIGAESPGFMNIGENFIARNGVTFKVVITADPDTVTYPEGKVVEVQVNPLSAPLFSL